jgi:hypothetical protein
MPRPHTPGAKMIKARQEFNFNLSDLIFLRLSLTGQTGLEPATSAVTGRCSNQLNYCPLCFFVLCPFSRHNFYYRDRVIFCQGVWENFFSCFSARVPTPRPDPLAVSPSPYR